MSVELHLGDCLTVMEGLADGLADSLVTDPPAGIAFMGKDWDKDCGGRDRWVEMLAARLAEARRVCKPGAYSLVWALPRTSHWTALALEEAGWVIRDRVSHLFGQGFPKSKSCLKPACEDWWLAWSPVNRVPPLPGLDACRIEAETRPKREHTGRTGNVYGSGLEGSKSIGTTTLGRWPANITHDGSPEVMEAFGAFGESSSRSGKPRSSAKPGNGWGTTKTGSEYDDTGTAARFFYCSKASRADRDEGLDGMPKRMAMRYGEKGQGPLPQQTPSKPTSQANHHPTVKPTELMRWLCRLITPQGGTVLDPFTGSGSTGKAAMMESLSFIGIEQDAEYLEIARRRIEAARTQLPLLAG
jgi:site-specific DNA-methyltransferase (adenine-specific)